MNMVMEINISNHHTLVFVVDFHLCYKRWGCGEGGMLLYQFGIIITPSGHHTAICALRGDETVMVPCLWVCVYIYISLKMFISFEIWINETY